MPVRPNPAENPATFFLITAVRSERGYSATNYDANPAKPQKSLRRQFGEKYDHKKVRNNYVSIPLPLAAALELEGGEAVQWQLWSRADLRLIRLNPSPPKKRRPKKR